MRIPQVAALVAIFATVLVFLMALYNMPLDVTMVLLFVLGLVISIIMTYLFFNTAKTHSILVNNVVWGLNAQRRKNNIEIDWHEYDQEKISDLKRANTKISDLAEQIVDEHKPVLLWNVLPLTKQNVIKLGGALAASLFTTVLRVALSDKE